ncbi:flagellar basal body P-ring formation chaperone FlgA [Thiorhodovibrio frisius]|uniref:Flagella basal body P-ring formation protein FlgA n=1 Tax=Thiorhodovibrio frisius TaxID=631362 RepID=H8YZN9_9GAMM|nr:flagellar basal body P-ring formation chaperone FlgA [Thiorhodovibrio frisius]EIC22166.1 flagella basal body P-ring formation protein FlgA [Thiorhodovibrio frisius]WPL24460.1 Flagella basal body P-ring formation protein FlgA precursor [Thiorhodovibrio frisius]
MLTSHQEISRPAPYWRRLAGLLCLCVSPAVLNQGLFAEAEAANVAATEEIEPVTNIQRAAKTFLHREAGGENGATVKISVDPVDPRLRLKLCDHDLQASFAPGANKTGNTSVKIQCQGPVRWSLFVSARVERFGEVVVAASPMSRGSMVTPADVKLERRETGGLLSSYFDDLSDAVGMQVRRSLRPGDVVTDSHLKTPLWVERGQLVRILSENPSIRVSMSGEALEDGGAGDRIRVRNRSSQRVLEGIIESPGVVRVPN